MKLTLVVKNLSANAGDKRDRFDQIPCRGKWQPIPALLPGESHGQKSLVGYSLSSVQFSCSVVSDSLRPHESQHARPPCPSPTPGVHSDSRPSSQ